MKARFFLIIVIFITATPYLCLSAQPQVETQQVAPKVFTDKVNAQSMIKIIDMLITKRTKSPRFLTVDRVTPKPIKEFSQYLSLLHESRNLCIKAKWHSQEYWNSLLLWEKYFQAIQTYQSQVLCDMTKRLAVEYIWQNILLNRPLNSLQKLRKELWEIRLKPSDLTLLINPELKNELLKNNNENTLVSISAIVSKSWGKPPLPKGVELSDFQPRWMLSQQYNPTGLLLHMLDTDMLQTLDLEGAFFFLEHGGKVDDVQPKDGRYLDSILTYKVRSKYSYPLFNRKTLNIVVMAKFFTTPPDELTSKVESDIFGHAIRSKGLK